MLQMHPLFVSVGVEHDTLHPGQCSLLVIALEVVNMERARDPLCAKIAPVGPTSQAEAKGHPELDGPAETGHHTEATPPQVLVPYLAEWLEAACWLNYLPVLVMPDTIGAAAVAAYFTAYAGANPFDNRFVEMGLAASGQLTPHYQAMLEGRLAHEKALAQAAELRRLQSSRLIRL